MGELEPDHSRRPSPRVLADMAVARAAVRLEDFADTRRREMLERAAADIEEALRVLPASKAPHAP